MTDVILTIHRHVSLPCSRWRKENRSLSNYIEKLLKEDVAKHESKHARTKIP
jgi:predicted secreted Zn-dependent protease